MKKGTITHIVAIAVGCAGVLFSPALATEVPISPAAPGEGPTVFAPTSRTVSHPTALQFNWKKEIVTTVFWIGEKPSENNPVPNKSSSWDANWTRNYGGYDDPDKDRRRNLIPVAFTPQQNPFYCALPYNDKAREGHRPEAPQVVPWFKEAYQGPAVSTCKGHWVAIRKGSKTAYAQWEDAGPFRTDHWQYVFGNERPKPNLNQGAGLDVSPAIRDYLGLQETDVTDWKFVDFKEVPAGPWARFGDNNPFVSNKRNGGSLVQRRGAAAELPPR
jgi:hypothetical protein